jgi:Zn-dependent protease with chaperone function
MAVNPEPKEKPFTKAGFIKSCFLPLLITFLIPGFGLWFFKHVEGYYDNKIRTSLLSQIRTDREMTPEQREKATQFYQRARVSRIMASNKPEAKELQETFSSVRTRYAIFRWMKRISALCLITGVAAFLAAGIGVLFSLRSQHALYWSLRVSWNILRWFAVVEVLGQGAVAVALSFWITAFWAEQYYPKLIAVIGLLAVCAVVLLVKAIFLKLPAHTEFNGRLLKMESAPELWQRITQMAAKLGIAPPDNFFVGIDDNFFVTQHPVKVGDAQYSGRTLFASLSLLKCLSRSEADAVLAHELAHFSGADTLYSRKTSPLLERYFHYLGALYQGGISRPIFYFMFFFWNLYHLVLNKIRREREFRADRIGGEMTSPRDISQALLKTTAYSRYRHKVQAGLFEKDENVETMDVFRRIETGFPAFLSACASGTELAEAHTPHPFDSHPPLAARIQSLGLEAPAILKEPTPLATASDSWFSAIENAAEIEAAQWKEFEEGFQKAHQEDLAWRFKPEGDVEIRHVIQFFPELEFRTDKGLVATLDYEKLRLSDWDSPVYFTTILSCRLDEQLGRHRLVIEFKLKKKEKCKVSYKALKRDGDDFLRTFQKYYARHMTAKKYLEQKAAESKSAPPAA